MPTVSLERLPVQMLSLGLLGFDHLQIVFQTDPGGAEAAARQDGWFVIEGLREAEGVEVRLAVEGWHGGTTLSEANAGLAGEALEDKIGTSASRGARALASGPEAIELWATLVAHAADIEAQKFPYIALALPGSALPTLNSSSLVASLLHRAGVDVATVLPAGLRFSPGLSTLLGTSQDDTLAAAGRFTTLAAGDGDDVLRGSDDADRVDKLFGGRGDDTFHWSRGVNVLHGGQPGLAYEDDGLDTVDYSGAGDLRLEAPAPGAAHVQADFIVFHDGGQDQLYSIEEVAWDGAGDRLSIGRGVGLAARPLTIRAERAADAPPRVIDLSSSDLGFDIVRGADDALSLTGRAAAAAGSPLSVRGAGSVVGSPFPDRFILADASASLTVDEASAEDRLLVAWRPSHVSASYDRQRPQDLVIRLVTEGEAVAHVRVRNHRSGDLGLVLDPSLASGDCVRLALADAPEGSEARLVEGFVLRPSPAWDGAGAPSHPLFDTFDEDDALCHHPPGVAVSDAIDAAGPG